jgi:hypothetical protein
MLYCVCARSSGCRLLTGFHVFCCLLPSVSFATTKASPVISVYRHTNFGRLFYTIVYAIYLIVSATSCFCSRRRCIYAYFMGIPIAELPFKDLLTHHIYELTPGKSPARPSPCCRFLPIQWSVPAGTNASECVWCCICCDVATVAFLCSPQHRPRALRQLRCALPAEMH